MKLASRYIPVEKEIVSIRSETFEAVDARFDSQEAKIPVMERMAKFEVRLLELEKKLAV